MAFRIIKIISIITILILSIILALGIFFRTRYINPVLMYHYVAHTDEFNNEPLLNVSPEAFERQMRFLKLNQYNVISLEELAENMKNNRFMPRNTVVITFDDGHLDNYEVAYPILKKYGLKATMFVILRDIAKPRFVNNQQIREMNDSRLITIGSHTINHLHLPAIKDKSALYNEIFGSKKMLEAILGKPANTFCYPLGGFTNEIEEMVKEAGYKLAVCASNGRYLDSSDIYAIKRLRVSGNSNNLFIFWFESTGLYKPMLELRQHLKSHNKDKWIKERY